MCGRTPTTKPGIAELERQFRRLTLLMYDTNVPLDVLEAQVCPYLSQDVEFLDPWIRAHGRRLFEVGLRGFHCAFLFDFVIFQIGVRMNERGDGGRVTVDGVMNLRQLRLYSYPLRTILVYEFAMTPGAPGFEITRLEEMWSFADLVRNAPALGRLYEGFRFASSRFFVAFFRLSCAVATRVPWARQYPDPGAG